jgi:hypothetical protein
MRAALQTEKTNVNYRIKHLEVERSSEVEISRDADNCQLESESSDSDVLVPSGDAADILADSGEDSRWYNDNNPPGFFGCTMQLSDPASINPEGQTLTMDVRSNYTVRLDQQLERFRVVNSRCSRGLNCPLLVTYQFTESSDRQDNWDVKCEGPDASNGCSVVEADIDNWASIEENLMTGPDLLDAKLEDGEYAYNPFESARMTDSVEETLRSQLDGSEAAIGVTERQFNMIRDGERGFAVISSIEEQDGIGQSTPEREVRFVYLDGALCSTDTGDPVKEYDDRHSREFEGRIVFFKPRIEECGDNLGESSTSGTDLSHEAGAMAP